jgi:ferric-chelate reductase (NADPH)
MSGVPNVRRVRHETKRRDLTIARVESLGSTMRRIVARGEALEGFTSLGFDDHVKPGLQFYHRYHSITVYRFSVET